MAQALVQHEHRHPHGDREDLVALLDRVVGCDDPGVVAARCLSRLDLVELGALPVLSQHNPGRCGWRPRPS